MRDLRDGVLAAVFLAVVMTGGDFLWAAMGLPHRVAYGLAHGAAMCLCLGLVLGLRAGRPAPAVIAGPAIGLLAAASFYMLVPWLRFSAMVPAWMLFWILFALLQQFLDSRETYARALGRGLVAAILSGAAFYAISGIWTRPGPTNYAVNLGSWAFAFFPGFVALFGARRVGVGR